MIDYSGMSYNEEMKLQKDYLDKIDFMPYIKKYDKLSDLKESMENIFVEYSKSTDNNFLQGCLFNYMDLYDISNYIRDRYNIDYKEVETIDYVRAELPIKDYRTPKKPVTDVLTSRLFCPNCSKQLRTFEDIEGEYGHIRRLIYPNYCENCGQALLWHVKENENM